MQCFFSCAGKKSEAILAGRSIECKGTREVVLAYFDHQVNCEFSNDHSSKRDHRPAPSQESEDSLLFLASDTKVRLDPCT